MKELKFKPDLLVPFDGELNQMAYDYQVKHWIKNEVFTCEVEFVEFLLGRSSVKAVFKSRDTGHKFEMFLSDFELLVKNELLIHGRFRDKFHYEKRGASWGVVPHLGREIKSTT